MELLPTDEWEKESLPAKFSRRLRAPAPAVKRTGVQRMPPRPPSADISVVYLPFRLHLRITKGTAPQPDSIHHGLCSAPVTPPSVPWEVCRRRRQPSNVCLAGDHGRRRMPN